MKYYAIARGKRTGIFLTSKEFNEYNRGNFSCGKKCKSLEEANSYLYEIDKILQNEKFAFVDLEFTCSKKINDFKDKKHIGEILSIGIVITNNKGKVIDTFYQTIKPKYNPILTSFCIDLTHLTQEEIDNSESVMTVLEKATNFVKSHGINNIICFGRTDKKQALHDIENYKDNRNYKMIRKFINKFDNQQKNICKRTLNLQSEISLNDLKKILAIQGEVSHNALSDAIDLSKVYFVSIYQPPSSNRINKYLRQKEELCKYKQFRRFKNNEQLDFKQDEIEIINKTCDIIENTNIENIDKQKIKALIDDLQFLSKQKIE